MHQPQACPSVGGSAAEQGHRASLACPCDQAPGTQQGQERSPRRVLRFLHPQQQRPVEVGMRVNLENATALLVNPIHLPRVAVQVVARGAHLGQHLPQQPCLHRLPQRQGTGRAPGVLKVYAAPPTGAPT
jgi:hypothetical protein